MWKVSACNCSICQIKVRGNIFLCIGAFSRQGAGYARANETASASPKSFLEKQLANRPGRRILQAKRQGAQLENRTAHTVPDMITKHPAASKGQSVIT